MHTYIFFRYKNINRSAKFYTMIMQIEKYFAFICLTSVFPQTISVETETKSKYN